MSNGLKLPERTEADKCLKLTSVIIDEITTALAKKWSKNNAVSTDLMDEDQSVSYDLAWLTAEQKIAENFLNYAWNESFGTSELEKYMALCFAAESVQHIRSTVNAKPSDYGITISRALELFKEELTQFVEIYTNIKYYSKVADLIVEKGHGGVYGLSDDHETFRDTFRRFAEEVVKPHAEHVHRHDDIIPQAIIDGLNEMGVFGLCIPEAYGGFQPDSKPDNISMLVVTEELSRGSLGIAGSLITRPEIASKALLKGGTQAQKDKWLAGLASGEYMVGVAVTEPDYGSDVASMSVTATKCEGGWKINGVKTWCTFAGYANVLLVLCRTESDPSLKHKGLSMLFAEKPRFTGHSFDYKQPTGGHIEGKAIPTIGYRGMHSFEVAFEDYFVPEENLIGGDAFRGKGFYLQMEGFAGGRIQTAARANGVMQASFESGLRYALDRKVFKKPIFDYNLTKYKVARMAMIIQASRQYTNYVGRLMDDHKGQMEATLIKFYASKVAEWVAREAMQIHGGMGYAEEYPVSRYYVDARVFSIFEGAEEVMALRVIAKGLLEAKLTK